MNLDETIKQSEQTNGHFSDMSERAQALKFIFRQGSRWPGMSIPNKEALENMASNIAVLLEGDDNEAEIWNRIAGYARTRGLALQLRVPEMVALDAIAEKLDLHDKPMNKLRYARAVDPAEMDQA